MHTKHHIWHTITTYSFILLWGAAVVQKLGDVRGWRQELEQQVFPLWVSDMLWWLLPAVQVGLILLLVYRPTASLGVQLSTVLIMVFTLYLLLGATNAFGRTPCACGGLWPSNDHWLHIRLNSIFVVLGIGHWVLAHRSRPAGDVPTDVGRKEGTTAS